MLADIIESITGFRCEATDETGECVEVFTPRPFVDDPEVFLFIQNVGKQLLLSDGAEVYFYHGHCKEALNELALIVRGAGLEFTNATVKLYCDLDGLGPAVEKFLSVISALAAHECDFNRMWAQSGPDLNALAAK
ncbi:hypothetical protein [Pseudoduganella sp. HUAS MS19]